LPLALEYCIRPQQPHNHYQNHLLHPFMIPDIGYRVFGELGLAFMVNCLFFPFPVACGGSLVHGTGLRE